MIETVIGNFTSYANPVYTVSIPVKLIIAGFPVNIKENNDTKSQTYGQTKDIDQCMQLIPDQYPESNLKETGKHHQILLIKRKCPMNIPNIHAIEYIGLKFKKI
jgi:hypothetical protein